MPLQAVSISERLKVGADQFAAEEHITSRLADTVADCNRQHEAARTCHLTSCQPAMTKLC
jgi:hypothetical protein